MVAKSYILSNLKTLEKLYSSSTSYKKGLFYSKLAILELCGWIEESMDGIIRKCVNRKVKRRSNRKFIEKNVIRRTSSFEYDKHFRNMLIQTIGMISLERLEQEVDSAKFSVLESTLATLKACRDKEAHTHLKGTTRTVDAPSVTKSRFVAVYEGLKDIDEKLRNLGL